ncbi:MAG: hypothetical protein DMF27_05275, partial [Verrucomicrobia bacterium]
MQSQWHRGKQHAPAIADHFDIRNSTFELRCRNSTFGLRRILELLRVQAPPHLLGQREMKFAVRIVLWLGAIALTIFGLLLMAGALDSSGSDAAGRGLSQAYGMFIALLGGAAVLSLLLTRFWRGFLVIGGLCLSLPFVLVLLLSI